MIEELNEFKEYIKNLDINLASLEQLGIIFILVGYLEFYDGAYIDILEALEINTNNISPDKVTVSGQYLILIGYILLWVVADQRVSEKNIRTVKTNENFYISAYAEIADSYLLSVIAHSIRLQAFEKIAQTNSYSEDFII